MNEVPQREDFRSGLNCASESTQDCGYESNNEKYRSRNSDYILAARESGPKSDWSSDEYLC